MERHCPSCGKTFSEEGETCPHCGASLTQNKAGEPAQMKEYSSPWDDRDSVGFFRALVDTWTQVMFSPARFFSRMPPEGGLGGPLLYGFIMGEVGFLFTLMWKSMSALVPPFVEQNGFGDYVGEMMGITFLFFASPALVLAALFIFSGVLYVCLLIVGGTQRSFEATFRVVCYASSTDLLDILPCCGWIIGLVWNLVLTVVGIRETHKISTGRAALAVLLPAIVCCGFLSIIFLIALPYIADWFD